MEKCGSIFTHTYGAKKNCTRKGASRLAKGGALPRFWGQVDFRFGLDWRTHACGGGAGLPGLLDGARFLVLLACAGAGGGGGGSPLGRERGGGSGILFAEDPGRASPRNASWA